MIDDDKINKYNNLILNKLSIYLNNFSTNINKKMVNDLVKDTKTDEEEAFRILIFTLLGFNIEFDKEIYDYYFREMIKKKDINYYQDNLYYKNIKITNINTSKWKYKTKKYSAYEAFVYDDLKKLVDGRIIPSIGYFDKEYCFPCVLENNREWMLITPNEIETMKKAINEAYGKVLTYGLGLGYFQYMISLKENVDSITIVDIDEDVINLFEKYILP